MTDVDIEVPGDAPAAVEAAPAAASSALSLPGERIAGGRVAGRLVIVPDVLGSPPTDRVAREAVEDELNRFRRGLGRARAQLRELRSRLRDEVGADDARILDTHLALSKDSAFIADVENLILGDQLRLEAAIGKVVGDFDRIFRLVKSEELRRSAADLRDVGLRVLRNLDGPEGPDAIPPALPSTDPSTDGDRDAADGRHAGAAGAADAPLILVARELSVVDLFDLERGAVAGLVSETGGPSSHAAILARSMGVPVLTGVEGATERLTEGQVAILDADRERLDVADDPADLEAWSFAAGGAVSLSTLDVEGLGDLVTRDGKAIAVLPACAGADEVGHAVAWGAREIGLYRTEIHFATESEAPDVARLEASTTAVCEAAAGSRVTFRLLHADGSTRLPFVDPDGRRPGLNRAVGARWLLARPDLLQAQLSALLLAGEQRPLRIAIPFVDDVEAFCAVRDALVGSREALRKAGRRPAEDLQIGITVDHAGALLGIDGLCEYADFVQFNLDALTENLLVVDRDAAEYEPLFESLHPFVLRALSLGLEQVQRSGIECSAFGGLVDRAENVPLLLGLGLRRLCPSPHATPAVVEAVRAADVEAAAEQLDAVRRAPSAPRGISPVAGFRHGFVAGD